MRNTSYILQIWKDIRNNAYMNALSEIRFGGFKNLNMELINGWGETHVK